MPKCKKMSRNAKPVPKIGKKSAKPMPMSDKDKDDMASRMVIQKNRTW